MDEFKAVSEVTKPDIICIVETWLNNEITDVEVNLPDYQLFRLGRCGRGEVLPFMFVHFCHVRFCFKVDLFL